MRKAILHLKNNDPVIGRLIDQGGPYRIQYQEATFANLVRSIVFQQVSGRAASAIYRRLEEALGPGGVSPAGILKLSPRRLRALGLSRQKAAYIRDLAAHTQSGQLNFNALGSLDDSAVMERLTAVKGIGPWTAQMFLIFSLRRPDVLPTADLGIRAAIRKAYGLEELPSARQIEELARAWRPYCTVACWYLWKSIDGDAALW